MFQKTLTTMHSNNETESLYLNILLLFYNPVQDSNSCKLGVRSRKLGGFLEGAKPMSVDGESARCLCMGGTHALNSDEHCFNLSSGTMMGRPLLMASSPAPEVRRRAGLITTRSPAQTRSPPAEDTPGLGLGTWEAGLGRRARCYLCVFIVCDGLNFRRDVWHHKTENVEPRRPEPTTM